MEQSLLVMEIQDGQFYINKTNQYLLPIISDYGISIIKRVASVFKLGVGIGDAVLPDNVELNNPLFMLIDINMRRTRFLNVMEWFREQDFFIFDYSYDDIIDGNKHMIVIETPKNYINAYEHFLNSEFSKMYSELELNIFFKKGDEKRNVLLKNEIAIINFVDVMNEEFDSNYSYKLWEELDNEADFPIMMKEEIFNYNLIQNSDEQKNRRRTKESCERAEGTVVKDN